MNVVTLVPWLYDFLSVGLDYCNLPITKGLFGL